MGLKNNFFQAMRELFGGEASEPSGERAAPAAPQEQNYADETEQSRRRVQEQDPYPMQPSAPVSPEHQFEDRMKSMLASSGLVGDDLQEKAQASSALDSMTKNAEPHAQPVQPVPVRVMDTAAQERAAQERAAQERAAYERAAQERAAYERAAQERAAQERATAAAQYPRSSEAQPAYGYGDSSYAQNRYSAPFSRGSDDSDAFPRNVNSTAEITIISKNTLVTGNIRSFAGIYIEGNVNGNIEVVKNADINGKIIGNVTCSDTRLNGALIQGDINSKGRVFMDKNAMLVGNMNGQSMDIDGKIKGDIDVGGRIGLRENSVVIGNISAGTIAISDGANVQGYINTTFLKDNGEAVFPQQITLNEEENAFRRRD